MNAGKILLIGSEDIEVWPSYCGDGHRCIQCFFNGKYFCAPRWRQWIPSDIFRSYPTSPKGEVHYGSSPVPLEMVSDKGRELGLSILAQPLDSIPDGGACEDRVDAIKAHDRPRLEHPYRITDDVCHKCGYEYLVSLAGSFNNRHKNVYTCPQCHTNHTQGSRSLPRKEEMMAYFRELFLEGISYRRIVERIYARYDIKISLGACSIFRRNMGLVPRESPFRVKGYWTEERRRVASEKQKKVMTPEHRKAVSEKMQKVLAFRTPEQIKITMDKWRKSFALRGNTKRVLV